MRAGNSTVPCAQTRTGVAVAGSGEVISPESPAAEEVAGMQLWMKEPELRDQSCLFQSILQGLRKCSEIVGSF